MHRLTSKPLSDLPSVPVVANAMAAMRIIQKLPDVVAPPEVVLWQLANGAMKSAMLAVAVRLQIADHLSHGAQSASELAERTNTVPSMLYRLLRALSAHGVFTHNNRDTFQNNRASEKLRAGVEGSMRDAVLYLTSNSNLDAWRAIETTVRTGEAGFDRHHGESVWQYFAKHPDEEQTFASAMSHVTLREAAIIAKLYPWNTLQTLCDIGGGSGGLLSELLVRNSQLRGVLCEIPANLQAARQLFSDRELLDRVSLVAGSFFDEVHPGAQAYLLKNILHDWNDTQSQKILTVVRRAMTAESKLLIVEAIEQTIERRPEVLMSDMQMGVVCGGKERTLSEFGDLLGKVGLKLNNVYRGALNSVLEATVK